MWCLTPFVRTPFVREYYNYHPILGVGAACNLARPSTDEQRRAPGDLASLQPLVQRFGLREGPDVADERPHFAGATISSVSRMSVRVT